jgi:hypothetical protein
MTECTDTFIIFMLCFTAQNPCSKEGQAKPITEGSRDCKYYIYITIVMKIHWYVNEITLF